LLLAAAALLALNGCGATSARAPRVTPVAVVKPRPVELEHEEVIRPRRVVVTETSIVIIGDIQFVEDSTAIAPDSVAMLDAVASIYFGSPSIKKVQCSVYIGDGVVADRDERLRLAQDRASVIIEKLVERGVERDRLVAAAQIDTPPVTNPSWIILDHED
jgi:outer membrane protein OmpA-like peptidoglycan-associated protein